MGRHPIKGIALIIVAIVCFLIAYWLGIVGYYTMEYRDGYAGWGFYEVHNTFPFALIAFGIGGLIALGGGIKSFSKSDDGDMIIRSSSETEAYQGYPEGTPSPRSETTRYDYREEIKPINMPDSHGKICEKCGEPIEDEWKVCPVCGNEPLNTCKGCGERLENSWIACPSCGSEVSMICNKCGAKIEKGWKACPLCSNLIDGA